MKKLSLSLLALISTQVLCGEWYAFTADYQPVPNGAHFDKSVVENQMWEYVKKQYSGELENRDNYDYQYQVLGNQRYKVNAFCDSYGADDPGETFLVVLDGGSCFFEVEYNSRTKLFKNLFVIGEA